MSDREGGPIAWAARNPVAANLFMVILLLGGIIMLSLIVRQEVFPDIDMSRIVVTVAYPGASPEEVERGIIFAVEDALKGIDGIREVKAVARESVAAITVTVMHGADLQEVQSDIRNAVDRITTFPQDAEDPLIESLSTEMETLLFVLYGEVDEYTLKELAEAVREDLLACDNVSRVDIDNVRPLEISVEVPQDNLRALGITLADVASIIRNTAVEMPAGELRAESGKILLRTMERRDWAEEFADIVVVGTPGGARVKLGDIARISDGFAEIDQFAFFDGKPAVSLKVYRVGDQTPMDVSRAVSEYRDRLVPGLPPGVEAAIVADRSELYRDRVKLLTKNGLIGLVLILLFLGLFLRPRVAFWVGGAIPLSLVGSMLFLPAFDVSINMISLFAFIVTLGIVIDNSIVVGENIFEQRQHGLGPLEAAVKGTKEVVTPVSFSVLTTLAAFTPLLFVVGDWGKIMRVIPVVVMLVLLISLFKAFFILPARLALVPPEDSHGDSRPGPLIRFQHMTSRRLVSFARNSYGPAAAWCVRNRWATLALALSVLMISFGYVQGGRIPIVIMPTVDADWVNVEALLPHDSPIQETHRVRRIIEEGAHRVLSAYPDEEISQGLISMIVGSERVILTLLMTPADQRTLSVRGFADAWRASTGDIAGLESLRFESAQLGPPTGKPVELELRHTDMAVLEEAGARVASVLGEYDGVIDVDSGTAPGKPQLSFRILPEGRALGLTAGDAGRQVRHAVFGVEALEQQRGRDPVSVMVRLPRDERDTEKIIDDLVLHAPGGGVIPLRRAVDIERGRSYTAIHRTNGSRTITVTADVLADRTDAGTVIAALERDELPLLRDRYPGLSYAWAGDQQEGAEAVASLITGFMIALLVMYCMVAIPLRSYLQPVVVLFAIPFGFVGALAGHILFGYPLSLMSMFGVVALSGVVINASLILIYSANVFRSQGASYAEALQKAGVRRFRPIILTSLTTFIGLGPMIFETSMQARFLIPMALSLGFGVLFATLITLFLVPAVAVIMEDLKDLAGRIVTGRG